MCHAGHMSRNHPAELQYALQALHFKLLDGKEYKNKRRRKENLKKHTFAAGKKCVICRLSV